MLLLSHVYEKKQLMKSNEFNFNPIRTLVYELDEILINIPINRDAKKSLMELFQIRDDVT